ncbi:MAG: hypothetical protein PHX60_06520 [Giesbergeria sp.]|uniref:DUF3226 domain-containing protein n=1 Tax=Giesbergeria sp. TaxID=2818473 RepID=UPI0026247039|nr:DUF3226 domain-containing protein [Giesbergeria sp.]MDD2609337.1 hypothetical protein [Giesbergeria sp.]
MSAKNILLVEGESDRGFFEALCKQWRLPVQVKVSTPRDAGHAKDTKQAVLSVLETTYLSQLADGQIERLAIAVDADRVSDGGGFERTLTQLSQRLHPAGYALDTSTEPGGLLFTHNDGLHDIGVWIMPNNADEGALEHWIQINLHPAEDALMQHARASIDQIPHGQKFKSSRRTKAEVSTWLAWQAEPDHGLWQAAKPGLLDETAPQFQAIKAWLEKVFPTAI